MSEMNRKVNRVVDTSPANIKANRDLKEQGFKDGTLNPMDYVDDKQIPKEMIIKYKMQDVRKQNAEEQQLTPIQIQSMRESFIEDVVNKGLYENLKKYKA